MAIPSDAHMLQFGRIMYHYASVETGIKISLAGMMGLDLGVTLILTEPYSALNLKNVAKSLNRTYELAGRGREEFAQIIGDFATYATLRNSIAHFRWTDGSRPGSIKPRSLDIRSGAPKYIGDAEDEKDWTVADLKDAADNISRINVRLYRFAEEYGLLANMDKKMKERSASTDSSDGSPTSVS